MQNINQIGNQNAMNTGFNPSTSNNHGGHEMFDAHEIISCLINMLDQYQMYGQYIQDPELKSIAQRQTSFVTQMYNTMVESFQTGQDPAIPTQQYKMTQNNNVIYGLQPGQPKKPNSSVQNISDQGLSAYMLSHTKSIGSAMTMAAAEITNPVLRRVVADSIPNFIEMGYELFLYQNKRGYYQVPKLNQEDMNIMLNGFAKAPQNGSMTH